MRVAIFPAGKGGVAYYRCIQPYTWLRDNGHIDLFIYNSSKHNAKRIENELGVADVIVYQMPASEKIAEVVQAISAMKNKYVICEFDDYLFDLNPFNQAYQSYGTKEITITYSDEETKERMRQLVPNKIKSDDKDGIKIAMWKDGENGFDLKANKDRISNHAICIASADLVTVSTKDLGAKLRKMRKGPIVVLPNLIDPERVLPMMKNDTDEIRIGWQGGSAHFEDFFKVSNALVNILKKNKNVKLVMQGGNFASLFKDVANQVEFRSWHTDVNTFPLYTRMMKADIGICPLKDHAFNRSKSALKWIEFGAMKVPCVCSDVTYSEVVKHGKTGFIANTEKQWEENLQRLIDSKELREEIGNKAYDRVIRNHSIDHSIMWKQAIDDTLFAKIKKKELVLTK